MRKALGWLLFMLMLVILIQPAANAAGQGSPPVLETCDSQPAAGWKRIGEIRIEDGACRFGFEGRIYTESVFTDYHLRFRLRLEQHGVLKLDFSNTMMDRYELTISVSEAKLTRFESFGNASSTVKETRILFADVTLPVGQWAQVEVSQTGARQTLMINGVQAWEHELIRFSYNSMLTAGGPVAVDDLQIDPLDLSVDRQSLDSFTPGLAATWIAFQSSVDSSLWLVHPDGSGKMRLEYEPEGTWGIQPKFSPDGRYLAILRGGPVTSELTFLDMTNLTPFGPGIRGASRM